MGLARHFRRVRVLLGLAALVAGLGVYLYIRACQVPADYTPVTLTAEGRARAQAALEDRIKFFLSEAGEIGSYDPQRPPDDSHLPAPRRRFRMELTQRELNEWAAIIAEKIRSELEPLGMSAPAVALGGDRLTLYVRWDRYGKVVGLDLALKFDAGGSMTVELTRARIGRLVLPRSLLIRREADVLRRLQAHVRGIGEGSDRFAGQPKQVFRDAAARVADALAGRPVRLDLPRRIAHVRVRNIELERGAATLDVVSLLKD